MNREKLFKSDAYCRIRHFQPTRKCPPLVETEAGDLAGGSQLRK